MLSQLEQPQAPEIYAGVADSAATVLQQFRTLTEPLLADYDLSAGPWDSWDRAKFQVMKQWTQVLMDW